MTPEVVSFDPLGKEGARGESRGGRGEDVREKEVFAKERGTEGGMEGGREGGTEGGREGRTYATESWVTLLPLYQWGRGIVFVTTT